GRSVIGGGDQDRAVPETFLLEAAAQGADDVVRVGEIAVIQADEVLLLRRRPRDLSRVDRRVPDRGPPLVLGQGRVRSEARIEGRRRIVGEVWLSEVGVREEAPAPVRAQEGRQEVEERL